LEEQKVAADVLVYEVKCEERVPEMIKNTHENHEIESLMQRGDVPYRQMAEFDVKLADVGGETGLTKIAIIRIDAQHAAGATPLHFHGVEARIATDIEYSHAGHVLRKNVVKAREFDRRIVSEEVLGRGLDSP
jgi:hypothetical protein